MSPENQWLEDVFPTKIVPFWGTFVRFQGCILQKGGSLLKGFFKVATSSTALVIVGDR